MVTKMYAGFVAYCFFGCTVCERNLEYHGLYRAIACACVSAEFMALSVHVCVVDVVVILCIRLVDALLVLACVVVIVALLCRHMES